MSTDARVPERITVDEAEDCRCSNAHPHLDEFVLYDVASVHFEAMGQAQFWMAIRMKDGREFDVNFGAVNPNARGYARIEEGV
jgi:hypothetical protein